MSHKYNNKRPESPTVTLTWHAFILDTALHALLTARTSNLMVSNFPGHSTSFLANPLQGRHGVLQSDYSGPEDRVD